MKIYHISDLHFGKTIYGKNMLEDQKDWVEKFLEKCREGKPQAVLIAGDVYDSKIPSGDAVDLLDYMLTELADLGISIFLIAGNHDNGQRLSFGRELLARQNVYIGGVLDKELVHYTLEDENGPVTFWLVPYLYPELAEEVLHNEDIKTYEGAMKAMLAAQNIDWNSRNVIVAHQFVVGSAGEKAQYGGSESSVAGIGAISYTVFDGFEYVALGHIHSTYHVGRETVRYAGTPLCYHFDEARKENAGLLLENDTLGTGTMCQNDANRILPPKSKGIQEIILGAKNEEVIHNSIEIKPLHRMRHIVGSKKEVYEYLEKDAGRDEYVGIAVTDQKLTYEEEGYLRSLLGTRKSMFVNVSPRFSDTENSGETANMDAVESKTMDELFVDFYREQKGGKDPEEDEVLLIQYLAELVGNQDMDEKFDDEKQQKAVDAIIKKINQIGGTVE